MNNLYFFAFPWESCISIFLDDAKNSTRNSWEARNTRNRRFVHRCHH